MEVTFIVPCSNVVCYGLRTISAYLKSKGYPVRLIFVAVEYNKFDIALPKRILDQLAEMVRSSKLIGLSVMTNYLGYAQQITRALKRTVDVPILWGGIHPTIRPKECLEFADFVCVGEGEEASLELANSIQTGQANERIQNLWLRKDDQIIENDVRPLVHDLDKFPDPDYELPFHFILHHGKLVPMTERLLKQNVDRLEGKSRYSVFTTRGCPHTCTFCCNSSLRRVYKNKGPFIRKRSIPRVIQELKRMKENYGFESICIQDENFLVRTRSEMENFVQEYRKQIGLPFQCEFSPQMFHEKNVEMLIGAGLTRVQVGIQSACKETNVSLYNRHYPQGRVDEIVAFFARYQGKIVCNLHFLVHNPWEDDASLIQTIHFVAALPSHFGITIYPLVFFPETELGKRAEREGYVNDYYRDVVYKGWSFGRVKDASYLVLVLYLIVALKRKKFPLILGAMKLLTRKPIIIFFGFTFIRRPLGLLFYYLYRVTKMREKSTL
jgi:anaerobic magnesium-protoporphyrin IX monomethyl ester cyclase